MKLQTVKFASLSRRCSHHDTDGRQCRTLAFDAHSGLCSHHLALEKQTETANVYAPLIRNSQGLQTAQGINYSLNNLYELLAKNHISPRRASVLAYINSLLLRTLPQIDADKAAGIIDPTKPIDVPVADEDTDTDTDEDSDLDSDDDEVSETESNTITLTDTDVGPSSTNTWDASIPEPDPKKKPS